jgi:hypothetical protein
MSRRNDIIDRINVQTPCDADWDAMVGNDRIRVCEHCQLSVHNLSKMSFVQIEDLVAQSNGRLCVRYFQMPDGSPVVARRPSVLLQLGRKSSRIAAGALTVAMAMSSAGATYAQGEARVKQAKVEDNDQDRQNTGATVHASIKGVAVDANGAAIARAIVTITSVAGKKETVISGEQGDFHFELLDAQTYTLEIKSIGFMDFRIKGIKLAPGDGKNIKAVLQVAPSEMGVYGFADGEVMSISNVALKVPARPKESGFTQLMSAVANNDWDNVKRSLATGENVNAQTSYGITALMRIGFQTSPELVKVMLLAGADLHLMDYHGKTALMYAASNGSSSVLQTLIDAGANIDVTDNEGNSALIYAVIGNRPDNVKILISAKANLKTKNVNGFTALKYALAQNSAEIIRMLKANGATE